MRKVGLAEAKAQLSALLAAVETGEDVVITHRAVGGAAARAAGSGAVKPSPGSFHLDTCLLISLFHNGSGSAAVEAWLVAAEQAELWISLWVLLEFASATTVRLRRGDLNAARAENPCGQLWNPSAGSGLGCWSRGGMTFCAPNAASAAICGAEARAPTWRRWGSALPIPLTQLMQVAAMVALGLQQRVGLPAAAGSV